MGLVAVAAIVTIVSIGIIAAPKIASLFNRPHTQAQAHKSLQDISAQLNFPGTLVYEKITDQGCGPDTTTWLKLHDVCAITLDKFYKASGSAVDNMKLADNTITNMGWQLWLDNPDSKAELERSVRERESAWGQYLHSYKATINLQFYPFDDPRHKDSYESPQQLFGLDQDIPLTGDEYIYGVQVSSTYGK